MNDALPEGWAARFVGRANRESKTRHCFRTVGSNLKSEEYVAGEASPSSWYNVDGNRFLEKKHAFHHARKAQELSAHTFQAGDIVITKLGDHVGQSLHRSEIVASRRRRCRRRVRLDVALLQTLTPCLQSTRRQ